MSVLLSIRWVASAVVGLLMLVFVVAAWGYAGMATPSGRTTTTGTTTTTGNPARHVTTLP